jgi:transcriptional regulator with XRE-family HTH domain
MQQDDRETGPRAADFDAATATLADCRQELSARLRTAMRERRWTQQDLVAASGLRKDQISVYVRGRQLPRAEGMARLAAAFGIEEAELLPGIDQRRAGAGIKDEFRLESVAGAPDRVRIHLRRELPTRLALDIATMLTDDASS